VDRCQLNRFSPTDSLLSFTPCAFGGAEISISVYAGFVRRRFAGKLHVIHGRIDGQLERAGHEGGEGGEGGSAVRIRAQNFLIFIAEHSSVELTNTSGTNGTYNIISLSMLNVLRLYCKRLEAVITN
jgi:hypothetical protein